MKKSSINLKETDRRKKKYRTYGISRTMEKPNLLVITLTINGLKFKLNDCHNHMKKQTNISYL